MKRPLARTPEPTNSTYDSGGNLATRTDARNKTGTYSYDALNRVTSIAYPDKTVSYGYDAGANGVGRPDECV